MDIGNLGVEAINYDDEEVELDLEGMLDSALEDIEKLRKKNKT